MDKQKSKDVLFEKSYTRKHAHLKDLEARKLTFEAQCPSTASRSARRKEAARLSPCQKNHQTFKDFQGLEKGTSGAVLRLTV